MTLSASHTDRMLRVELLEPVAQGAIRVRFNRELEGQAFLDHSRYHFGGGDLHCVGVLREGPKSLLLLTTEQEPDKKYSLEIRPSKKS